MTHDEARALARAYASSPTGEGLDALLGALKAIRGESTATVFVQRVEDIHSASGLIEIEIRGIVTTGKAARRIVEESRRGRLLVVCE